MKMMKKGYKRGGKTDGKMPDLSGDGEITQEDVLIGRGVLGKKDKKPTKKMKGGKMVKKGYAKGGKVRGAGIARQGVRPCKMR